jgi:hypothetical protein
MDTANVVSRDGRARARRDCDVVGHLCSLRKSEEKPNGLSSSTAPAATTHSRAKERVGIREQRAGYLDRTASHRCAVEGICIAKQRARNSYRAGAYGSRKERVRIVIEPAKDRAFRRAGLALAVYQP